MWEKGNISTLLVGILIGAISVEALWKLNIEIPYDPVTPLLGIYIKKARSQIHKDIGTPIFIAALYTIAKIGKQPKCPSVDEWIKKMWYIYTMGYYSAMRRKQILLFATPWMELEGIMLSEISQVEKDKYQINDFPHLWIITTKQNWRNKTAADPQTPRRD